MTTDKEDETLVQAELWNTRARAWALHDEAVRTEQEDELTGALRTVAGILHYAYRLRYGNAPPEGYTVQVEHILPTRYLIERPLDNEREFQLRLWDAMRSVQEMHNAAMPTKSHGVLTKLCLSGEGLEKAYSELYGIYRPAEYGGKPPTETA